MPFKLFDTTEVVAFAKEIASEIQRACPNTPEPATVKSIEKSRKKLDTLIARTNTFSKQHQMNNYKKAKFLNVIKWELKESGHDQLFINEIVRLLALVIN